MVKKVLIALVFICLLLSFNRLGAQNGLSPVDLENKLKTARNDSDRVKLLLLQVKTLYDPQRAQNIDEVIRLNNRAIVFAEKSNYLLGLSKCYSYAAKFAMLKNDPGLERNYRLKLDKVNLQLNNLQAQKLKNLDTQLENTGKEIESLHSDNKNKEKELTEKDRIIIGKDTVISRQKLENQQKVQELKITKQEGELKDSQFKRQQLATRLMFAVSVAIAIILIILLFSFYNNRRYTRQIAAEKERSDKLLLNILPAEVAAELKEKGTVEAQVYNNVTVLFTDFEGFTKLSEKLSPQQLVNEIGLCYSKFDEIVARNKLEKIKTIGDAYMCAGGLPERNVGHTERAVKAALEMVSFIEELKNERIAQGRAFFQVRIGLHCGPVVAGVVGTHKFAYDIWGDVVNTAARMESAGEVGKVNISAEVYEWVKEVYACQHRGKVQAKNKGEIDMYFVLGEKTK